MDAETKKNIFMKNVAPGTYEGTLTDKKNEPKWRYVIIYEIKFCEIKLQLSNSFFALGYGTQS